MNKLPVISLLLFVFLWIISPISAQNLSLSDVLQIHQSSDSIRTKILLSHGFRLAESAMKELNNAIIPTDYYTWTEKDSPLPPLQTMVVVRTAHPRTGKKMETSYILFSREDYMALQVTAWGLGYKYVKKQADKDSNVLICENESTWLRFFEDIYPENVVYGVTIEQK